MGLCSRNINPPILHLTSDIHFGAMVQQPLIVFVIFRVNISKTIAVPFRTFMYPNPTLPTPFSTTGFTSFHTIPNHTNQNTPSYLTKDAIKRHARKIQHLAVGTASSLPSPNTVLRGTNNLWVAENLKIYSSTTGSQKFSILAKAVFGNFRAFNFLHR